jgi:hypothetical protein
MEKAGYVPVPKPDAESGLWQIEGKRQVIYVRTKLPEHERLDAARHLARNRVV